MKRSFTLFLLLALLALLVAGCSLLSTPEPTATPLPTVHPGQSIVHNRCTSCHDLDRAVNYKSDAKGWGFLVDRMIILGATLSEQQRDLAVDWLATTYPKE